MYLTFFRACLKAHRLEGIIGFGLVYCELVFRPGVLSPFQPHKSTSLDKLNVRTIWSFEIFYGENSGLLPAHLVEVVLHLIDPLVLQTLPEADQPKHLDEGAGR